MIHISDFEPSSRSLDSPQQKCQRANKLLLEDGQQLDVGAMDKDLEEELKELVANGTSSEELAGMFHAFKLKV